MRYSVSASILTCRSNGVRRFTFTLLAVMMAASPVTAQQTDVVRSAADGTRFRVIDRIPAVRRPIVEPVQWPFPAAVKRAVEADDWAGAWAVLEPLPPPDDDRRFAFLWAWVALGAGANDAAQPVFAKLADGPGLFVDYANLYAAEAAFRAGRFDEAAEHAARVPSGSVPYRSASLLLGRALVANDETEQGERALRAFIDAFPRDDEAPLARTELARSLHARGKSLDAAKILFEIRRHHPLWSGLDASFDALEKETHAALSPKQRGAVTKMEPSDWLTEYRVRFRAHQSETVVSELGKVVAKWPKKSSERCEALYLVGASYTKLRKHADSIAWYDKTIEECGGVHRRKAFYKGGKAYWNAGKKDRALETFERLWTEFSSHSYADDAMFFSSRILREQSKSDEAKKLLRRQVKTYPDGDMAANAHWLLLREHFAAKDYDAVVAYVDSLADTGERDLYSRGRAHYFRARALHKQGKEKKADAAYQAVVRDYPMSYYALFALNRLAELRGQTGDDVCAAAEASVCDAITIAPPVGIRVVDELKRNEAFQLGQAFLQVGLDGFARLEFHRLRRRAGDGADAQWAIAALLDASGAYPYSHDIPRRHIDGWEEEYPDRQRSTRWHVGYPTPFSEEVERWATKRGLPEALIWAIMREESGFNPRVRSWAGAIGLMQLMPGTAKMMAKKDGWRYAESELTDPDVAIRIGSAYLDDLAERSGQHPALIIAGYNGGWGNVSRWLTDPDTTDLDVWVEDIPYGQTRDYTKRVLRSFWVYSWLYGDERVPRFTMKVPG